MQVAGIEFLNVPVQMKKLEAIRQGLGYGDAPATAALERESALVFLFKYLSPPEMTRACAPEWHREIVTKIYANLGVPVEFGHPQAAAGCGRLEVQVNRNLGAGFIRVNRIGADTLPEIVMARRDLCELAGVAAVFLDLPLAQGGAPALCDGARSAGFFFSGVRPGFAEDGDFLRLQYLNAPLDPERIHLAAPFARELLDYILRDRARVGSHGAR
jgi:hypothetical protein